MLWTNVEDERTSIDEIFPFTHSALWLYLISRVHAVTKSSQPETTLLVPDEHVHYPIYCSLLLYQLE